MNYANGRNLALSYNNRMFLTQWSIPNVMRWNYAYNYFNENTGRVSTHGTCVYQRIRRFKPREEFELSLPSVAHLGFVT